MPNRDGTGPFGKGSGTGKGWRGFYECDFFTKTPTRRRLSFFTAAAPVFGALIKDITNPNGVLRTIVKKLIRYQKTSLQEKKNKRINAKYTIIDHKDYNQKNNKLDEKQV